MDTTKLNNPISLMSNAAFEISAGILIDMRNVEYEISTMCNNKDITDYSPKQDSKRLNLHFI